MNVKQQAGAGSQPDQATLLGILRDARERLEIFQKRHDERVAIIGLAGRFPGADDIDGFWQLLAGGGSGLTAVTDADLESAGIDPQLSGQPDYVRVWGGFSDPTAFDAGFFGYAPREAQLLDPQQRVFLECAWNALEHAGYGSGKSRGRTGVYAGGSLNYHFTHIHSDPSLRDSVAPLQAGLGNVSGMIASRVAYHLDLEGPSVGVQATCATGLVSVHLAVQALLSGECEMAVAGAVSVGQPKPAGYLYEAGGIGAPDGQCRPFDAAASGTIFTNGVGAVILKRLGDARAAGDTVYAVIAGSAIGNDGSSKVGLTAPSVKGQASVLKKALANAGIAPSAVDYVEAHATATAIGDPIELTALNRIYGPSLRAEGRTCLLGSLKGNVGHMDAAAGIGGLIKTVLALRHECLPASGNFTTPSGACDFESSPFRVAAGKSDWKADADRPRRAAISAFGMGGSNAHVIIEEAPARQESAEGETGALLLPLSARSAASLAAMQSSLSDALSKTGKHQGVSLADVAHTLQTGRETFNHRSITLATTLSDAAERLKAASGPGYAIGQIPQHDPSLVFMFSGQGSQHVGMARSLYEREEHFRAALDECLSLIPDDLQIRALLLAGPDASNTGLDRTDRAQPALFAVEYALARMWMHKGLQPRAMIGHSVGEYVAACLAGVFSLKDAMFLVLARGRLMQGCAAGGMLSVMLTEADLRARLDEGLEIAAVNGPGSCVVAGDTEVLRRFAERLEKDGAGCRLLRTSHAFHSAAMEPILEEFAGLFDGIALSAPAIDVMSNLSGNWLRAEEARSPAYWTEHLRRAVNFSDGMKHLLELSAPVLLEVGPGSTLSRLARQQANDDCRIVTSLPDAAGTVDAADHALLAFGQLWLAGIDVRWEALDDGSPRRRVGLPGYHFERQSYWIAPPTVGRETAVAATHRPMAEWFHQPVWKTRPLKIGVSAAAKGRWLVFGAALPEIPHGIDAVLVGEGATFSAAEKAYTIDPASAEHLLALFDDLAKKNWTPDQIISAFGLADTDLPDAAWNFALALARTLAAGNQRPDVTFIGRSMHGIFAADGVQPAKARINGLARMLSQELLGLSCRSIDVQGLPDVNAARCLRDVVSSPLVEGEQIYALRDGILFALSHERVELSDVEAGSLAKPGETYLVIGELLGGLGLVYARALIKAGAKVILAGRAGIPLVPDWERWLASHSPRHPVSLFIQTLRSLGTPGKDYLLFSGDVSEAKWLRSVLEEGEESLGTVKGVFHTAAMGDQYFGLLGNESFDAKSLQTVKSGTIDALDRVLGQRSDIFVLVQSSLSSIVGGKGLGRYAAENAYLDAFVSAKGHASGPLWKSVNWDACASVHATEAGHAAHREITPEEVWQVTALVLSQASPASIVVTPYDLENRPAADVQGSDDATVNGQKSARSGVSAAYAAPQGPLEEEVVAIMAELLGINGIGVADNFFELGGHSLLAIQVVARLRKRFDVEIPMRALLFDAPTAAGLARVIQEGLDARNHEADMLASMLDDVEAGR
ncbi:acyltransferase domain-containing protein [Agrobacterium sp. O3.4]|uniref:Acyltransferase domain-containing protein n=1 Tax=Agrobacterium cucumeris TaxID=2862866 RepID=A0ABY8RRU1_9HYPH|nr:MULTISPECIES: type I polyketide synthase [Rhizobium/Agrobacterium group]MCZ7471832.1 beta-ketoacyl synthase N-terminal-like domain-containing protein [Rhizobium rhizogenes]WHO09784.1 acyltransferase domain-containing protein [Agrobacterium cucumeris]